MSVDDGMRGLFGESPDPFGFDFGLGGVASYLPGQESAFNADVNRQIIDATISGGLASIPQIGASASPANYLLRNISVEDGIQQNEINAVVSLLNNNLVTIDEVAARTGIPASEIQAVYNQVKGVQVADVLNDPTDATAGTINLTVGSNQMLSEADLAAAQAAAAQPTANETVDLTADTTANELLTGGLGDGSLGDAAGLGTVSQDPTVDQATVSDVNETWTYNKATDSFISSTRGDSIRNAGNADLKDGGVYAVTPVLGTDGVMAENVVDTETNESVGIFSIDINTGLPTITKSVDAGTGANDGDTFNTARDTLNTGETLTVGDTTAGSNVAIGGDDFNTAADTNNTGQVLTVGDTTIADPVVTTSTVTNTPTVINGVDGVDGVDGVNGINGINGQDGRDGQNGRDGRDGRDGIIGLFSAIQSTPVTDSLFFEPKFTELDNIPVGMFERFLRATGGR